MFPRLLLLLACGARAPEPAEVLVIEEVAPPERVVVHLTVDDVPWQLEREWEMTMPPEQAAAWNDRLRQTLGSREVPVSVFITCNRLQDGDGIAEAWAAAGAHVGNHGYSHLGLGRIDDTEAWLADMARCSEVIAGRIGARPTRVRHPYLDHGNSPEQYEAAVAGLRELGLVDAPVTLATTEWMHGFAYRRARARGDVAEQERIVEDWLDHMDGALDFGVALAQNHPGRPVPQVVLVHANELVADHVGELVDRWNQRGVEWVGLEEAMADPVFSQEPTYYRRGGVSWLHRVTPDMERLDYWFGEDEGRIVERFGPIPAPEAPEAERVGLAPGSRGI